MKKLLICTMLFFSVCCAAQVYVNVTSPTNNASVSSLTVNATASSPKPIVGWHIYADSQDVYAGPASSTISANISLAPGAHALAVRAWDSGGAYSTYFLNVNVTKPATAPALYVNVTSPTNSATVSSSFTLNATASGPNAITGWHIYSDNQDVYVGPASSSISANLSLSAGSHSLAVRAWDTSGAYTTYFLNVNVTKSAPTPSPVLYVNVTSPTSGGTVSPSFTLNATASGPNPIAGWHIYSDDQDVYAGSASSAIAANLSLSAGSHSLAVRAWDTTGAYTTYSLNVNVSGSSSALPTPPSTAKVFDNIDQMSGWGSCGSDWCAGGSGKSNYWQALNQSSPSMDGNSMQLYNSGVWANSLWWQHLGANNWATNMLWDFWIYVDGNAASYAEALEFDSYQFVGGYNYMIGTECNYSYGVWDTWNEATGQWIHNYSLPCPKFTPNTWHHIQQYVTLDHNAHTYTYKTFVVDGKAMTVNQTQPAKYVAWGDNIGAQWQIDINASGNGVHEWVDKAKLTIW